MGVLKPETILDPMLFVDAEPTSGVSDAPYEWAYSAF